MRVFVTGATGHIGSAVVSELLDAGHQVVGLARSDRSAAALKAAGAEAHRGSLDDLDTLHEAAATADGVIHLAFKHDFSDYQGAVTADLRAVQTIGAALEGSGKPFVVTSGTLMLAFVLPPGQLGTEADVAAPPVPRIEAENTAIALSESGVRSSVVRLPPSVHSSLDLHGFVPRLIETAREKGVSAYIADGANRWPAVHTLDAARLFRLALEKAPAGTRLHGTTDEGVPFRDIAETIGRHIGVPTAGITREEADAHFGFLGTMASLDNPTSSSRTQELLAWRPERPGLIADIEAGHYFDTEDNAS
ncbi:SDR family oxidoreductase [Streptomyces seoulensis]|nr:SDR family oxidoreductase [Streptomyces seoulensis]